MRTLLLCGLLAGCAVQPAAVEKPIPVVKERDCPILPKVPRGADRNTLLAIIELQAGLYRRCAGASDD